MGFEEVGENASEGVKDSVGGMHGGQKFTKDEVEYRMAGEGSDSGAIEKRCGTCIHFLAPGNCEIVSGNIVASGLCDEWMARNTGSGGFTEKRSDQPMPTGGSHEMAVGREPEQESSYGGGWREMLASLREFANECHNPGGEGGGEFCSSTAGGPEAGRLSSSKPSGVKEAASYKAGGEGGGPRMTSDLIGDKAIAATIERQSAVPGFEHFGGLGDSETGGSGGRETLGKISDQMAQNIVAGVDESMSISKDATDLHSQWYPRASEYLGGLAKDTGFSKSAVVAAAAVLSPGADWADNLSWCKHMAETIKADPIVPDSWAQGHYFTRLAAYQTAKDNAEKAGKEWTGKEPEYNAGIVGKHLSELSNEDAAQAIRGWHDAEGGGKGGGVKQLGGLAGFGEAGKYTIPQSDANLAKAVSVLRDPSAENVDKQLGGANKVRSFYNNLRDPLDKIHEDTTIDTHAYGQANGLPWGISSPYIASGKLSVTSAPSNASTGVSGTYPLIADAYRKATNIVNKKYGTDYRPNQVQSIVWEMHRANFPSEVRKPKMQAAIAEIRTRLGSGAKAEKEIEAARVKLGAPSAEKIKTQFENDVKLYKKNKI